MFRSLLRGSRSGRRKPAMGTPDVLIRLHIGGTSPHPDWKILNAKAGPGVDFLGNCVDLSFLPNAGVSEVYASHVLEHLGYQRELHTALDEIRRVLVPDGILRISVPDIAVLGGWIANPVLSPQEHFNVMRMIYGAQGDAYDFHKFGFSMGIMQDLLAHHAFTEVRRVETFGLFDDTSELRFREQLVSLNVIARKPGI